MVICAVINCGNRSARVKGKHFFRFPKLLTHLGAQELDLSKRRRVAWLASLKRKELSLEQDLNIRVCSDHYAEGGAIEVYCNRAVCHSVRLLQVFLVAHWKLRAEISNASRYRYLLGFVFKNFRFKASFVSYQLWKSEEMLSLLDMASDLRLLRNWSKQPTD